VTAVGKPPADVIPSGSTDPAANRMSDTPTYASLLARLFSGSPEDREAVMAHLGRHPAQAHAVEPEVRDRLRDEYPRTRTIAAEAMLRLFGEPEPNTRAFSALERFLELLDSAPVLTPSRPALDPLALSFQLKLLWLSGYLPHLTSCAECGADDAPLVGYSPQAGGAVCRACGVGSLPLSPAGIGGIETLLREPLASASNAGLSERAARDALRVVTASYEYHGGFRLRTLSA